MDLGARRVEGLRVELLLDCDDLLLLLVVDRNGLDERCVLDANERVG